MSDLKVQWWVGLFVLLGIIATLFTAFQASSFRSLNSDDGYQLISYFDETGGLKVRSPVTIAGVLVGRVQSIDLDPNNYEAKVVIVIHDKNIQIPEDTSASILTAGLLGEKYIGLSPGGMDFSLQDGGIISQTQSAVVLENLISKFLLNNDN